MNADKKNNTYIFDPESYPEMGRLIRLHRVISKGSPLAGLPPLPSEARILDLACGPGGWCFDVAHIQPAFDVSGVDISRIMVDYATTRARAQKLTNASFRVMDITHSLDFADASFDLINARLLVAVVPMAKWGVVLEECFRLLRPGGVVRLTDCDDIGRTTSPAFERLGVVTAHIMKKVGYGFSSDGTNFGMSAILPELLTRAGFQNGEYTSYPLYFGSGSHAYSELKLNCEISTRALLPLMLKFGESTQQEAQALYQQVQQEMEEPHFHGTWTFWCAVGVKSSPQHLSAKNRKTGLSAT